MKRNGCEPLDTFGVSHFASSGFRSLCVEFQMGKLQVKKKTGDAGEKKDLKVIKKTKGKQRVLEKEKLEKILEKLNDTPARKIKGILKKEPSEKLKIQKPMKADKKKVQGSADSKGNVQNPRTPNEKKTGTPSGKGVQKSETPNGKKAQNARTPDKTKTDSPKIPSGKGVQKSETPNAKKAQKTRTPDKTESPKVPNGKGVQKSETPNGKKAQTPQTQDRKKARKSKTPDKKSPVETMKRKLENAAPSKDVRKKPKTITEPEGFPEDFWILRYKTTSDSEVRRYLFLKPHEDNDKGLTVSNVPPFYGDAEVKRLLEQFVEEGKVLSVFTKRGSATGFKVMVAYFDSELWLQKFLENVKNSDEVDLDGIGIALPVLGIKSKGFWYFN